MELSNHPQTISHPHSICGRKIVFRETGPWGQKERLGAADLKNVILDELTGQLNHSDPGQLCALSRLGSCVGGLASDFTEDWLVYSGLDWDV